MSGPHDFPALVLHPEPRRRIEIGIRIPLPVRVRARSDGEAHFDGSSCLLLTYTEVEKRDLVKTLEMALDAIERGPRSDQVHR